MDRERHKGIIRYVCICLVLLCFYLLFVYFLARYETFREEQQMLKLLVKHPELEEEIIGLWEKFDEGQSDNEISDKELSSAIDVVQNRYGYDIGKITSKRIFFIFSTRQFLLNLKFSRITFLFCFNYLLCFEIII